MRTVALYWLEDTQGNGYKGFVPDIYYDWYKLDNDAAFNPTRSLAHDLVEHFPNAKGSLRDELEALGARFWLREWNVHEYGMNRLAQTITSAVVDSANAYQASILSNPPIFHLDYEDKETWQLIESAVEEGLESARQEFSLMWDDELDTFTEDEIARCVFNGARRATRRYGHRNRFKLLSLYEQLDKYSGKLHDVYESIGLPHQGIGLYLAFSYDLNAHCHARWIGYGEEELNPLLEDYGLRSWNC